MLAILKKTGLFERKGIWAALLLVVDVGAALFAFIGALALRQTPFVRGIVGNLEIPMLYFAAFGVSVGLLIVVYALNGLYVQKNLKGVATMVLLSRAHGKWIVTLLAAAYVYQYDFSRFIVFAWLCLSFVCILIARHCMYVFRQRLLKYKIGLHNAVVVGKGKLAREVERALVAHYGEELGVVKKLDPEISAGVMSVPLHDLSKSIEGYETATVYIADPQLSHEYILNTVSSFPRTVQFKIVADIFSLATGSFNVNDVDDIPTLDLSKVSPSLVYRYSKRIFDIVFSCLFLIVSFPAWVAIAVAIRLDSPGPIFLRQKRVGYKGALFVIYKFRTMHTAAALYGPAPTGVGDSRITRAGAFLRKTSLDELPQLINVLKGDMSLVGPRPEMPFIVDTYTPWQKKRLEAKPGITGLWQILGRKDLPLSENLEYDFYYINNQSLLLDFVILLKTVPIVAFGRGAY